VQPPLLVYLDQSVWIKLARAANGHADAVDAVDALSRLRALLDADLIVCALSNVHYMQTQAHDWEARRIALRERPCGLIDALGPCPRFSASGRSRMWTVVVVVSVHPMEPRPHHSLPF
jgi:hypothetical protein